MIEFRDVSLRYDGDHRERLSHVDFTVPTRESWSSSSGRPAAGSRRCCAASTGWSRTSPAGRLSGSVVVDGRDTRTHRPRDLADVVGFVVQDPVASFVTDTVEEEIAYGMEAIGVDATAMRRRVEETLDLLGLAELRHRPLQDLSGGQQQRVAIGAVLAAGPRILVLDEPTSALDPVAAEDVLAALHRLVHDLGITVVVAEHRLERVIHHADRVVLLRDGQASPLLDPAEAMRTSTVFPPVIGLGRATGWAPLPLSVRDARRRAVDLRSGSGRAGRAARAALPHRHPSAARVQRLVLRRGPVDRDPRGRPRPRRRQRDRGDGPERCRQVHPPGRPVRVAAPLLRPGRGRRARAGRPPAGASWCAGSAWCRRTRACCSTPSRSAPSAATPTGTSVSPPAPPGGCSTGWPGWSRTTCTRGTCPRASGWPWPWPWCWPAPRPGPAGRADPRAGLPRQGAPRPHPARPGRPRAHRRPGHPRRGAGGRGGRAGGRPGRRRGGRRRPGRDVLAGSPAFAPQVAKIVHPLPFLTVAEVTAALEPAS